MTIESLAPAKINLTLHVIGRRGDGYHLLDSLVVFADVADRIIAEPAEVLSLSLAGPQAGQVPGGADNLVLRAAAWLEAGRGAQLTLDKQLPVASGLGGGSSDAAAALRALCRLWGLALPAAAATAAIGADVPVCLDPRPRRMTGIGELLAEVPVLPDFALVLVHPGVGVSTQAVFAALRNRSAAPMPARMPRLADATELAAFLAMQRNDLQAAALGLAPVIGDALSALTAQPGCRLARMSGSGATCFGLFDRPADAAAAAGRLRQAQPGWWVMATRPLPA